MQTSRRAVSKGESRILVLSAIDLLLAALTGAFGLMLVLSSAAQGTALRDGAGARSGDVDSQVILQLRSDRSVAFTCTGMSEFWRGGPEELAPPFESTRLFNPDVTETSCTIVAATGPSQWRLTAILADGQLLAYDLDCKPGDRELLRLNVSPAGGGAKQRVGGGDCARRSVPGTD